MLKDHALQVTNGRAVGVKRAAPGSVCTEAGRKLANTVTARVLGPALLSVADAEAREGVDEAVAFAVTLSRAASGTVTVDYASADGTAVAGEDYTATSGTLTFAACEREKTVAVPILDDEHDEGRETFTLVLSNAKGAHIADGEAVGHDPQHGRDAEGVPGALRAYGGGSRDRGALRRALRRHASPGHTRGSRGSRSTAAGTRRPQRGPTNPENLDGGGGIRAGCRQSAGCGDRALRAALTTAPAHPRAPSDALSAEPCARGARRPLLALAAALLLSCAGDCRCGRPAPRAWGFFPRGPADH